MGKIVMGYWDCPVCGSKEIRGDVVNCPSCGRARGDVQFYLKGYGEGETVSVQAADDMEALSKEEAGKIGENPDWYCSFCNSLNNDSTQTCGVCGASRKDSEANYFEMLARKKEKEAAEAEAQQPAPAPRSKKGLFFLLLLIPVIIFLLIWMNGRKTGDWEVTGLNWERNIQIEEYQPFEESAWSLPAEAELISQREEIRSYTQQLVGYQTQERTRQVYDHDEIIGYDQVDRGNGSIELVPRTRPVYRTETYTVEVPQYISVPIMDTKYYYRIWRWAPSRVATASGSDHNTSWPDLNLSENEREAERNSRTEYYRFTAKNVKKPQETVTYRLSESAWMNISEKDLLQISIKNTGGDAYITDAQGARIADLIREK